MTSQQVGLLCMQLVVSLGVLAYLGVQLLRNHEDRQKYRLFAVRDRLLLMVATGIIPETSIVFKVFYRAMNRYVAELESVTILSFAQASMAAKTELEKENQQRLIEGLRRSPSEVQAVVDEFIHAVMDSLLYNSPMLKILLGVVHHCHRLVAFIRKRGRHFDLPVYDTYRYYESIHGTMGLI